MATLSLPGAVKIPLPDKFHGQMDFDHVNAFIFSVKQYFVLVGLANGVQQAQLTGILLSDDAQVWYMHQQYDCTTLDFATLKRDMLDYFQPADHAWRARDALARAR